MATQTINDDHGKVTSTSPRRNPDRSLDLFDTLGVPSPELARRLVRMLNLPAVVEQRVSSRRGDAA